jgi:hypothetical protein
MMLVTHGIGASLERLICRVLMNAYGHGAFYMLFSGCAVLLVWRVQPINVMWPCLNIRSARWRRCLIRGLMRLLKKGLFPDR